MHRTLYINSVVLSQLPFRLHSAFCYLSSNNISNALYVCFALLQNFNRISFALYNKFLFGLRVVWFPIMLIQSYFVICSLLPHTHTHTHRCQIITEDCYCLPHHAVQCQSLGCPSYIRGSRVTETVHLTADTQMCSSNVFMGWTFMIKLIRP